MIYLTLAYIIIFALSTYNNPIKEIKLDITFYVILFIILLFYLVTSYVVNYLYHMVIKKKNDQYEDINGQNEEISALYEEIIASEDVLKEQNDQLIELNREITKNRDKLEFLAYNDTLTGLPNRKMINEQLELLINYGEKNNSFSLVFIDIDNFKRINDSMGHTSGDDLLIKVAKRCQEYIDNKDLFGRLGGDELSILVRRHLDDEELFQYIQSICNLFEEPFIIDDIEVRITASFGIAVWPTDALTAVELLKASDTAMYKAKETGKNNVQFYRKDMKTEILSKLEMENKMIKALKENQFFLEYQPLFDINTKKVRCFEALIRWELPEIGRISPMDFIPFAEENGFIHEIGEWVLRDVSKKIRDIKSYYKEDISIAVNISTIQLKSFNFIERLEQIIIEEDINPKDIELEITESVLIEDKYQAIEVINKLRNLGFKISMDDFGTGYSSLSYLLELPIDKLKIDKSFIDAISVGNKKNEIVGAIVEMVHSLDMEVVAEGVETEGQFRYLKKKNCDIVQGYLLGRPLNDDKMKELLLNNNIGI
jgi:diguanylate cyclase (GGDEF)-like protein